MELVLGTLGQNAFISPLTPPSRKRERERVCFLEASRVDTVTAAASVVGSSRRWSIDFGLRCLASISVFQVAQAEQRRARTQMGQKTMFQEAFYREVSV